MEFLEPLFSLVSANSTLAILGLMIAAALGGVALFLDYRNERRARDNFGIERRRLSEVNLRVKHNVRLVRVRQKKQSAATEQTEQKQGAFMVLRMPLKNIGDGPIDIIGMLASARAAGTWNGTTITGHTGIVKTSRIASSPVSRRRSHWSTLLITIRAWPRRNSARCAASTPWWAWIRCAR
jgi:hypothetical protein